MATGPKPEEDETPEAEAAEVEHDETPQAKGYNQETGEFIV